MYTTELTPEQRVQRSVDLGIAVDPECYYLLEMFTWTQTPTGHLCRAVRDDEGNKQTIYLHHLVNGLPPEDMLTDHEDRDPTNNRAKNLRNVDRCKNQQNSDRIDTASCIYFRESSGLPYVVVSRDRKRNYLGTFDTVEEAAVARDKWIAEYNNA